MDSVASSANVEGQKLPTFSVMNEIGQPDPEAPNPFLTDAWDTATLYELRSAAAMDKRRDLLVEVARVGGDGLRTTCLKMPAN